MTRLIRPLQSRAYLSCTGVCERGAGGRKEPLQVGPGGYSNAEDPHRGPNKLTLDKCSGKRDKRGLSFHSKQTIS